MKSISENLFVAEQSLQMLGLEYGARMTVVRLNGGQLVVISPIRMTDELLKAVSKLGAVAYLVSPNSFHHLFIKEWIEKFPDAKVLVVPHIVKKQPDIIPFAVIDQSFVAPWGDELQLLFIPGGKMYAEAVFLHRASATLIVTDLCFNLHFPVGTFGKIALKMYGIYRTFGPSRAVAIFMGDKKRLRKAVDTVASWQFSRVIMAHGDILEGTTPTVVRASFDKIL